LGRDHRAARGDRVGALAHGPEHTPDRAEGRAEPGRRRRQLEDGAGLLEGAPDGAPEAAGEAPADALGAALADSLGATDTLGAGEGVAAGGGVAVETGGGIGVGRWPKTP
jgi:hypothetical protein